MLQNIKLPTSTKLYPSGQQSSMASDYLTSSLSALIKTELRVHKLKSTLSGQIDLYNKKMEARKMANALSEGRMLAWKEKEAVQRKKKFQMWYKKKQEREKRLENLKKEKGETHRQKIESNKKEFENVRQRYHMLSSSDTNLRLSRLAVQTAASPRRNIQQSLQQSSHSSRSASCSVRAKISNYQLMKEQELVSKYLGKVKRVESKVMQKEIAMETQRQKSLKTKVVCHVAKRQKQLEGKAQKTEEYFLKRMGAFQNNYAALKESNELNLMNKTISSTNFRKQVIQRKQLLHQKQISKLLSSIKLRQVQKQNSSNSNLQLLEKLDMHNSQLSFKGNMIKMKDEAKRARLDQLMKVLYSKINEIKNMRENDKLSKSDAKFLLGLIDPNEPEYQVFAQFLNVERKVFIQNCLRKEEDRIKAQKMKKAGKSTGKV